MKDLSPVLDTYGGMGSIGHYDGSLHLPKYSQSEMDAVIEENTMVVNTLKRKIDVLSSGGVDKVSKGTADFDQRIESLELQLQEEKRRCIEWMDKADELCMVKTQNKALGHRLKEVEDEMEQRVSAKERELTETLAIESQKRKALKVKHAQALEEMENEIKTEVLEKAKAQFEAQQSKYNAIVDNYNALRDKYEERATLLIKTQEELAAIQDKLESAVLDAAAKDSEISDLKERLETLQQDKTALVNASLATQSSIAASNEDLARMKEELSFVRQQASIAAIESEEKDHRIRSMKLEMETQLSVIGKLTGTQNQAELQVEQMRQELVQLTAKNEKLRSMNKEMLAMLEERT